MLDATCYNKDVHWKKIGSTHNSNIPQFLIFTAFLNFIDNLFFFQMGEDMQSRAQEWENLRHIIQQWNDNRLDLFEISQPDEVNTFAYNLIDNDIFIFIIIFVQQRCISNQ